MASLVAAKDAANGEFFGDIAPLAETLRNAVVGSWQGYLTALNAAASARDMSLNDSLTALTGTILKAEESYGRAMLAAGRRHDQAVVSAAADRDAALLDAIDAALDTSGNGTGLAFTAAEAQPIREAVARLRGVVTASATVVASAVDATATFLGKLADRGTALSRALNAADNAFFSAVESAETAALDAAFALRANYERAVIAADTAYANALATGSGEAVQNLATAIAERKTAAVESVVERDSNEFTTSAQHAPTWDANGRGSVFVDEYTLDIEGVLATLAAWDTAHPVVTNPPPVTAPPLDLGLPATPPAWRCSRTNLNAGQRSGRFRRKPGYRVPQRLASGSKEPVGPAREVARHPAGSEMTRCVPGAAPRTIPRISAVSERPTAGEPCRS